MRFPLTSVALAASIAVGQVAAAPLRVMVITSSTFPKDVSAAVMPFRLGHAAGISRVSTLVDSETSNAIYEHSPPNISCARAKMIQRVRDITNKLRAAFGLPLIEASHISIGATEEAHILPYETREPVKLRRPRRRAQTFLRRLRRSVAALSPWEGRVLSFVLGCGLGALLRMFFVFAIIVFRSMKSSRRPAIQLDDQAYDDIPQLVSVGSPPAYSDVKTDIGADMKEVGVGSDVASGEVAKDSWDEIVDHVTTVDRTSEGIQVYWIRADGMECVSSASMFAQLCPKKLIAFYESNLEWSGHDEE